jgi:hypothetical protein
MPHWHSYTSYSPHFDGGDMTAEQVEFLLAMAAYQKRYGRRYPTWLEVLHVLHCLGYRKVADADAVTQPLPPAEAGERPSEYDLMKAKFGLAGDAPP